MKWKGKNVVKLFEGNAIFYDKLISHKDGTINIKKAFFILIVILQKRL